MDGPTLKRLGMRLQKEIVPLHDLPFPMREALRKLAEKYDRPDLGFLGDSHGETEAGLDRAEMSETVETSLPKR